MSETTSGIWEREPGRAEIIAFLERLRAEGLPPYEPPTIYVSRAEYERLEAEA